MPAHVIAGHLVVILAPLSAVFALGYAGWARWRGGLRWPLLVSAAATAGLVVWAEEAAKGLLAQVTAQAAPVEIAAASAHAKGSDNLARAVFALVGVVVFTVWWTLRPGRAPSLGGRIAAVALAGCAVAVLITTGTTLMSALTAVWANRPG